MNKRWLSAALSVLFAASSIPSAEAATLKYTEDMENAAKRPVYLIGEEPEKPDENNDDKKPSVVTLGFNSLEEKVKKDNLIVQSIKLNLKGIANTDLAASFFNQEQQYISQINAAEKTIAAAKAKITEYQAVINANKGTEVETLYQGLVDMQNSILTSATANKLAAEAAINALEDAEDDAEDDLYSQEYTAKKALENTENQLTVAAQSTYIGIAALQSQLLAMDRQLSAVDRNIAVLEKQLEIGMGAQINLDNLRQSRNDLASAVQSLESTMSNTEKQLALLCGYANDTTVKVDIVPSVEQKSLDGINYEADLKEALKNSYSIWSKRDDARKASEDYEDNKTSTLDFYDAANVLVQNEKKNVENSFRAMYDDVWEKKRIFDEAKGAFETQNKNFIIASTKFERGMISRNAYLDAEDELNAKIDSMEAADREFFTAYNTYDWARKGFMSGTAS